mmetsp:Transcript_5751/g.9457  ORF Transcript_5751/g.9457 Transcript_5751/m.9457 type:complete len:195 (-) Transcript_5751:7-591(-)
MTSPLESSTYWSGSAWIQKGLDIDGLAAGDKFGVMLSMSSDGSVVAASAYLGDTNGTDSGEVRVFQWSGSAWVQMGAAIVGKAAGDKLMSVSLSGDGTILAVGGYLNDGNGADSGHARVYQWTGSAWVQVLSDIKGTWNNRGRIPPARLDTRQTVDEWTSGNSIRIHPFEWINMHGRQLNPAFSAQTEIFPSFS